MVSSETGWVGGCCECILFVSMACVSFVFCQKIASAVGRRPVRHENSRGASSGKTDQAIPVKALSLEESSQTVIIDSLGIGNKIVLYDIFPFKCNE